MDFQNIVDSLYAPTCVVSVEKRPDGGYGNIRLVAGNERYAGLLHLRLTHLVLQMTIRIRREYLFRVCLIQNTSSRA